MKIFLLFLLTTLLLSSCFLFKDYKKTTFTYNNNGKATAIPIIFPKRYLKKEMVDSAGNTEQYFYYAGDAVLYAAYLTDTTKELQPINKKIHQPQIHRLGGFIYKGQDSADLYYREIRQGNFRFGYRFVPEVFESQFDSATNFASMQRK